MPNTNTRNGMLGTTSAELKPTIKLGEVTDGLSNTILFGEMAGKQILFFRGKRRPGLSSLADGGLTLNSFYGDSNLAREISFFVCWKGLSPWLGRKLLPSQVRFTDSESTCRESRMPGPSLFFELNRLRLFPPFDCNLYVGSLYLIVSFW